MNDEWIPVELIDKTWQTNASGALVKCDCHYAIKRSDIERVVLDVYRRKREREWEEFELGRGIAAPKPGATVPEERPQHNTLPGLPTEGPFRDADCPTPCPKRISCGQCRAEERLRQTHKAVGKLVGALGIRVPDPTPCFALCHFLPVSEFYWIQDELAKVKAMLEETR